MKKRHVMRALVAAATALALTACGSTGSSDTSKSTSTASAASTSSSSEADTKNTISIPAGESVSQDSDVTAMVAVDFTTMDPMDTSDTLSGGVQRMMMDGLFGFDENMQIIPMLATSYEANDEATEYTIHLREGVSFTDGTPWNADALIANVNKWADKSLGLKRTTFLCNVLDHAEKIDDYTVKIYLSQSFGAFISNLAHPATLIMSPKQIEAGEDACAQAPVGTGQYKFVEWVAGDHMKVELNKDWWGYDADVCGGTALADADAGFKSITFKPVAESATRVSAIQAGDAQIMWSVPTESVDTLKGDSNVSVGMGDSIAVWYFFMNTQKAPFNDVKVREAMAYAINKEAYIQVVMNGYGSVATSMVGEEVQHYKGNDPYSYDPEAAVEELKADGWVYNADGSDYVDGSGEIRYKKVTPVEAGTYAHNVTLADGTILMPLIIEWSSSENNPVSELLNVMLAQGTQTTEAGMKINQNVMTFTELLNYYYRDASQGDKYAVPTYGMFNLASNFVPAYDQSYEWTLDPEMVAQGYNLNRLYNEAMDALTMNMVYGVDSSNTQLYMTYWKGFQMLWNELLPQIPLYSNIYITVYPDWLENYTQDSFWDFQQAILYATVAE